MKDSIQRQIERVEEFVANAPDANALPREAAQLLHMLILATGARRGVEIGTSYGYSSLWMAAALASNGGTLITIDNDSRGIEHSSSICDGLKDLLKSFDGAAGSGDDSSPEAVFKRIGGG